MATQPSDVDLKKCYKCGHENANQAFCGACGSPLVSPLRHRIPKIWSWINERRGTILTFTAAAIVFAGFVVKDGKLERAKEARSAQSSAKMILNQVSESLTAAGQGPVIAAEVIYAQNLPTLETQFRLLPIKREQLASEKILLIAAHERTDTLHTADDERRTILRLENREQDLVRLYKAILVASDGNLIALPKDKKQLDEIQAGMSNFETAWTSFGSDFKQVVRSVAKKAEDEEKEAEYEVKKWTWINYGIYVLAWGMALAGKLTGREVFEQGE
jgi:hypothetical protein